MARTQFADHGIFLTTAAWVPSLYEELCFHVGVAYDRETRTFAYDDACEHASDSAVAAIARKRRRPDTAAAPPAKRLAQSSVTSYFAVSIPATR